VASFEIRLREGRRDLGENAEAADCSWPLGSRFFLNSDLLALAALLNIIIKQDTANFMEYWNCDCEDLPV
jgi:hypothetical protein